MEKEQTFDLQSLHSDVQKHIINFMDLKSKQNLRQCSKKYHLMINTKYLKFMEPICHPQFIKEDKTIEYLRSRVKLFNEKYLSNTCKEHTKYIRRHPDGYGTHGDEW